MLMSNLEQLEHDLGIQEIENVVRGYHIAVLFGAKMGRVANLEITVKQISHNLDRITEIDIMDLIYGYHRQMTEARNGGLVPQAREYANQILVLIQGAENE